MSATRSAGTLDSSSADRVAVITVDNCLLSFAVGPINGVRECGSPSDGDRRLAKVVAGVVERMGLRAPRWAHWCCSDRSGWPWVARRGAFAGIAVLDRRAISIRWRRDGVSGWVRAGGGAREPGCLRGGHGQHLGCGSGERRASAGRAVSWTISETAAASTATASFGLTAHSGAPPTRSLQGTRAPHARRGAEQDTAMSRPRISMICDVSSGLPTTRPYTWIRPPTTARMAPPLGVLPTACTFRPVDGRGMSSPRARAQTLNPQRAWLAAALARGQLWPGAPGKRARGLRRQALDNVLVCLI